MAKMIYGAEKIEREVEGQTYEMTFDAPTNVAKFYRVAIGRALYSVACQNLGKQISDISEEKRQELVQREMDRISEAQDFAKETDGRGTNRSASPLAEVVEILTQFALNRGKPASLWSKAATLLGFEADGRWIPAAEQRERLALLVKENEEFAKAQADVEAAKDMEL